VAVDGKFGAVVGVNQMWRLAVEEGGQGAADGEKAKRLHIDDEYTEKAALSPAAACISRQCVALRGSGRIYL
jgi:hypothetical protein